MSDTSYLQKFKPLQVEVRGDFESSVRLFKSMVNRERVLSIYKEYQSYEKPSDKRRRKKREAAAKKFAADAKQKAFNLGEEKPRR